MACKGYLDLRCNRDAEHSRISQAIGVHLAVEKPAEGIGERRAGWFSTTGDSWGDNRTILPGGSDRNVCKPPENLQRNGAPAFQVRVGACGKLLALLSARFLLAYYSHRWDDSVQLLGWKLSPDKINDEFSYDGSALPRGKLLAFRGGAMGVAAPLYVRAVDRAWLHVSENSTHELGRLRLACTCVCAPCANLDMGYTRLHLGAVLRHCCICPLGSPYGLTAPNG